MITLLGINLTQILFLVLVGFAILQIIDFKNKISFFKNLPYTFGTGIVFLYIFAFPLVRYDLAVGSWYFYIYVLGIFLIILAGYFYKTANIVKNKSIYLSTQHWIILFFVVLFIALISYINITNPVVDSDASNNYRHIGIAKYIFWEYPLTETNAYKAGQSTELSPPILHVFINALQERWFDSIATVHYIFFLLFSLLVVFTVGILNHIKALYSLIGAIMLITVPITIIHSVRTGYADIIVAYFFLIGVMQIFSIIVNKKIEFGNYVLISIATVGVLFSKLEGIIWIAWLWIVLFSLYLNIYKKILWNKILMTQILLLIIGFSLYLLSAEWVLENITLPKRLSWMFDLQYNPASFERFFSYMFSVGGQGLIWWIYIISSLVLLIRSKNPTYKAITLYSFFLVLGVFYFSNFTFNITFTLQGTNVGRFFLQLAPLVILSYYLMILDIKYSNKK
jgi:hypothetical protein